MASSDIRGLLAIAAGVGTGIAAKRQNNRLLEQETDRTAMLSRGVASTLGAIDGLDMLDTERAALRARASTAYQYAASDDPKLRALGEQMIPRLTQALGESATRNDAERIALEAAEIEQANLERQNEQARIEGMYSRTQDLIGERTSRLDPIADGIERMERVRGLIGVGSPAAVESAQLALAAFLNEGRPTDKDAAAVQKLGSVIDRMNQSLAGMRGEGAQEAAFNQMNALIDAIQEPMRARAQGIVTELDERAKHGRLPVVESLWNAGYDRGFYTDPTSVERRGDTGAVQPETEGSVLRDMGNVTAGTAAAAWNAVPGWAKWTAAGGAVLQPAKTARVLAALGRASPAGMAVTASLVAAGLNQQEIENITARREGENDDQYEQRVTQELGMRAGAPLVDSTSSDWSGLPEWLDSRGTRRGSVSGVIQR